MARIVWVDDVLRRWGAWRDGAPRQATGYPRQAAFMRLAIDNSGYRDAVAPENEEEMQRVDRAVESLRITRSGLYVTVMCIYVRNLGIKRTAHVMQRCERTVKGNLEAADQAIALKLQEDRRAA